MLLLRIVGRNVSGSIFGLQWEGRRWEGHALLIKCFCWLKCLVWYKPLRGNLHSMSNLLDTSFLFVSIPCFCTSLWDILNAFLSPCRFTLYICLPLVACFPGKGALSYNLQSKKSSVLTSCLTLIRQLPFWVQSWEEPGEQKRADPEGISHNLNRAPSVFPANHEGIPMLLLCQLLLLCVMSPSFSDSDQGRIWWHCHQLWGAPYSGCTRAGS